MIRKPWDLSLLERLALLRDDTHRVAFLSPKPDSGTFRYRCFNPVQAINSYSTDFSASYFFLSDLEILDDPSDFVDTLVVVRTPYDRPLDQLFRKFKHRDKEIFFDIDDLVFDTHYATLVASNLSYQLEGEELNQWTAFMGNIGRALHRADRITTTNSFLAARIREHTATPVHVFPNSLNALQLEVTQPTRTPLPEPDALRIAYFSGSPSHRLDFQVALAGLVEFLRVSPHSTLTVAGFLDIPEQLSGLSNQIHRLPFLDFRDMQRELGRFDLNLVPLQHNAFTHSKSELKYFEAAAVSTPTLASDSPVFAQAISHQVNGFLTGPEGWFESLAGIAAMGPARRAQVGESAREHALTHYSPEALVEHLHKAFREKN